MEVKYVEVKVDRDVCITLTESEAAQLKKILGELSHTNVERLNKCDGSEWNITNQLYHKIDNITK